MEMARCMLGNILKFVWGEAVITNFYTINRCPTKAVEGKMPYEVWKGNKCNISHLRIFGCKSFSLIVSEKRKKLDNKFNKYIFMGYAN